MGRNLRLLFARFDVTILTQEIHSIQISDAHGKCISYIPTYRTPIITISRKQNRIPNEYQQQKHIRIHTQLHLQMQRNATQRNAVSTNMRHDRFTVPIPVP